MSLHEISLAIKSFLLGILQDIWNYPIPWMVIFKCTLVLGVACVVLATLISAVAGSDKIRSFLEKHEKLDGPFTYMMVGISVVTAGVFAAIIW